MTCVIVHIWNVVGIILSFYSGVYGAAIGYTSDFGVDSKKFIGISGILIGVGEIIGGALFGIFGKYTVNRQVSAGSPLSRCRGRTPVVALGYTIHMISFFLIFINLPADATHHATTDAPYIGTASLALALACSFLLGFGDACYNTQIMTLLGTVYADNSAPAYAVFKFVQSLAAAVAFFYSSWINLHIQLLVLAIFASIGTLTFFAVEFTAPRSTASTTTTTTGATATCQSQNGNEKEKLSHANGDSNGTAACEKYAPTPMQRSSTAASFTSTNTTSTAVGINVSQNPLVSHSTIQGSREIIRV